MLEDLICVLKDIRNLLSSTPTNENIQNIEMLKVADVAQILGINKNSAGELWNREDFPGIIIGHKMIEKSAFYKWLQERRQ